LADDPHLGEVLHGTYQVQAKVGVGGGGEVYLARHLKLEAPVAIKFLKLGSDERQLARFEREARIASSLTHPNIARVYDIDLAAARPFLVMEWVDGVDLHSLLESFGPLPLALTLDLFEQFSSAMHTAHKQGIVHRDLKPENMLVREEGGRLFLKLVDFGIARRASSSGTLTQGDILGTPAYLAPEVARGQTGDERSDIYAMGLLLYECLIGHSALSGEPLEIYRRQVNNLTEIPSVHAARPELPEALDALIARACASDPEKRFLDVAELQTELEHVLKEQVGASEPRRREEPPAAGDDAKPVALPDVRRLMRGRTSYELRAAWERRRARRNLLTGVAVMALAAGAASWYFGGRLATQAPPVMRPPPPTAPPPTVRLQIDPVVPGLKVVDVAHPNRPLGVIAGGVELPRDLNPVRLRFEAPGRQPVELEVTPEADGVIRLGGK
jgi:serine/threonine protein kinase